jgi:hypothetical protein
MAAIAEQARHLLEKGYNDRAIIQKCNVCLNWVVRLRNGAIPPLISKLATRSPISPLFLFDLEYHKIIEKHWGFLPAAYRSLMTCKSSDAFITAIDDIFRNGIINDQTGVVFLYPFFAGLFGLPYGRSFALSIHENLSLFLSPKSSLFGNFILSKSINMILKFIMFCVPPSQDGFVVQYFENVSILPVDIDPQIETYEKLAYDDNQEPTESSDSGLDLVISPPPRPRSPIDYAKARIARLTRQLRETGNRLMGQELLVSRLKISIKNVRREVDTLRECDAVSDQSDSEPQTLAKTLHSCMIDILKARTDVDPLGLRVDTILLNVSFVLQCYSQTGYEFMRQYLPLPNRKTIYRHFLERIRAQEANLSNIDFIPKIVQERTPYCDCITVAIDAIALDAVWISNRPHKNSEGRPKVAFVYHALPCSADSKCYPLHVMPASQGNASPLICNRANEIVHILAGLPHPITVFFLATDGDPGYNCQYQSQFRLWIEHYDGSRVDACIPIIGDNLPWYMADFLHLAKNVRSRLLKYIPVIRYGAVDIEVKPDRIAELLQTGPVLSDHSSTGKMRDAYPIALFRLEHVLTLFRLGSVGEALYLLPWALIMRALLSDVISVELRSFALELALAFLFKFYVNATQRGHLPEQGKTGIKVMPLKRITVIRAMNTVLGFIFALRNWHRDLPLDRMSTHPLENFFGLLRRLLHDCNEYEALVHAAAKNVIVTEVCSELHHPSNVCGRVNTAGIVSQSVGGESLMGIENIQNFVDDIMTAVSTYLSTGFVPTEDWFEISNLTSGVQEWLFHFVEISSTKHIEKGAFVDFHQNSGHEIMSHLMQIHMDPTETPK